LNLTHYQQSETTVHEMEDTAEYCGCQVLSVADPTIGAHWWWDLQDLYIPTSPQNHHHSKFP